MLEEQFEQLSAYIDGELTAAERRAVELWLRENPEAQTYYRRLREQELSIDQVLRIDPGTEQDPNRLVDCFQQRIWVQWGSVSGVAAVLVTGVLLVISQPPPPPVPSSLSQYILADNAAVDPYTVLLTDEMGPPR
jgi:anti-sigma factor RsiW